jgi:hypothetical protein
LNQKKNSKQIATDRKWVEKSFDQTLPEYFQIADETTLTSLRKKRQ